MSIFRTIDPTTFNAVDGIVINESAPTPNISGVAANVAILVGQTQRGPSKLTSIGSIGEFNEIFGQSSFGANQTLKNKAFGMLNVIRVVASDSVSAKKAFGGITFSALYAGSYGNNIQVQIDKGSSGNKYTVVDKNPGSVLAAEIYDNVTLANAQNAFSNSSLISVEVKIPSEDPKAKEPAPTAATNLAGGSDGGVTDIDYQNAISNAAVQDAGNIIFLDDYNAARNGFLKAHVTATQDKIAILAGAQTDNVAAAIADVATNRDSDGRIIYAYPWVQSPIDGVLQYVSPAPFVASVISQTSPHIDPAYAQNSRYLGGITGLGRNLSRTDYIHLKDAGILSFEMVNGNAKIKSGIVTQIEDSSKVTVLRRRMADYLTNSAGNYLLNFQNAPNTKENRTLVKGALISFVTSLENAGLLPKDSDLQNGKSSLIDTESLNTNTSIAAGFFKILWRQRIYSSMRYIVLQAEIGESVVVTAST